MWFALLSTLLPPIISGVEKLFGPKSGKTKLDTVVGAVSPILSALAGTGKLNGAAPQVEEVVAVVNQLVAQLFPPGTTVGTAPTLTSPLTISGVSGVGDGSLVLPQPLAPVTGGASTSTSDQQKLALIRLLLSS